MNRILVAFLLIVSTLSAFAQPERDKGLSLHLLPNRVAKISNEKGGFTVSAPAPKEKIPAMDAKETMEYFQHLPDPLKKNGIWIVYTHPSSYSQEEKEQLKKLIEESKEKAVPVFTCQASELSKNNWKAEGLIE